MSDYDSDDEMLTQTTVLLGYAGKETPLKNLSALDNHIGGVPIWLNDTAPAPKLTTCDACEKPLSLLAQLSCPLDDKLYDRVLYVFACPEPECRKKEGSVKAVRGIHDSQEVRDRITAELNEDSASVIVSKKHDVGDMIFGSSAAAANPFASSNPFETKPYANPSAAEPKPKEAKSKATAKAKPVDSVEEVKGTWMMKAVDVEEEYFVPEKPVKIEELGSDVVEGASSSTNEVSLDPEAAAIAEAVSDPTFNKFADLVRHNPEQVLRYERPLKIVPYAKDDLYRVLVNPVEIPSSDIDGSKRVFELQLMPHLISELETDDQLMDGMEWGTIAVATSVDDAFPPLDENSVGYAEEWVAVQWELE